MQLKRAREKATEQKLQIDFQKQDAFQLPFSNEFDLAIMLCEGSFPLMETDEMNFLILQSAAKALNTISKLIFTILNGLFPLFHSVKDFLESKTEKGKAVTTENSFDLMTFHEYDSIIIVDDNGSRKELHCNER